MTPEGLREFGYHVRNARIRRGWTLEDLAREALANPERKGYVSQIENGKRPLSARTIGNLARVLDLPESVTRPLLYAPAEADEVTREDRLAETLLRRNDTDTTPLPTAEALVIALAYEYAGGNYIDLQTAYAGLRGALQAAAEMRAELDRFHNLDDRLTAVLRRVADLNDQGLRDEAGDALDAAIKAKEAEIEALQDAALHQDRLRNRPATAARRMVTRLKAFAPASEVFAGMQDLIRETCELGSARGDPYCLTVALELACLSLAIANGHDIVLAQCALGNCHLALAESSSGCGHLISAHKAYKEALRMTSLRQDPEIWGGLQQNIGTVLSLLGERKRAPERLREAVAAFGSALTVFTAQSAPSVWAQVQSNLGTALHFLGEYSRDPASLRQAIAAFRAAQTVCTTETSPMTWAGVANNLGLSLCWLGALERDPGHFEASQMAFDACLSICTPEAAPFYWAKRQWNLAYLAFAWHALDPQPAHLDAAQRHLDAAHAYFAEAENTHQIAECHRLQRLIDETRAASGEAPSPL